MSFDDTLEKKRKNTVRAIFQQKLLDSIGFLLHKIEASVLKRSLFSDCNHILGIQA